VLGNSQRLDGGAMFGNAPRALWSRWIAPDQQHRIPLACRALLVREDSGRNVLCEAGIGAFFPPEKKDRYGVVEDRHVLLDSLAVLGLSPSDIDVIVLSHLHFDHAGGVLAAYTPGAAPALAFPDARFVVSRDAWRRAEDPHPRDRASFIPELQPLLRATGHPSLGATGRLELVPPDAGAGTLSTTLGPAYRLHFSHGHTPGLMLVEVPSADGPVVFAADLVPGVPWVHLPITMGYDRFPELLVDEKARLLADLVARGGHLFFTHDPVHAMGRVTFESGRYGVRLAETTA
jgi:glyoxylase-like metal-dependent hydrolase (beta-lactamase superfamily II)